MNNTIKEYILSNYDKYGILNEYNKPISKQEMLGLLNILESNNETLESFHDVALNGYDEFCGIFGTYDSDSYTYSALIAHHLFLSDNQFIDYMLEHIQELQEDDYLKNEVADYIKKYMDNDIYKTSDGYVIRFDY